jgi:hypothetical protein
MRTRSEQRANERTTVPFSALGSHWLMDSMSISSSNSTSGDASMQTEPLNRGGAAASGGGGAPAAVPGCCGVGGRVER